MTMNCDQMLADIVNRFHKAWQLNDRAHRATHFENVFQCGWELNNKFKFGFDNRHILLAAYFHDLFAWSRENHQILSYHFVCSTEDPLFEQLTTGERLAVATACLEHRASYKGKFTSPFSELFNSADREKPKDVETLLERSVLYAMDRLGYTVEDAEKHAREHIKEKFGKNGYARYPKMYMNAYQDQLEKIQADIAKL